MTPQEAGLNWEPVSRKWFRDCEGFVRQYFWQVGDYWFVWNNRQGSKIVSYHTLKLALSHKRVRPKAQKTLNEVYAASKVVSDSMRENNDCGVVCLQHAVGISYNEAHAKLKKLGRVNGKGTHMSLITKSINDYGYKLEPVDMKRFIRLYYPEKDHFLNVVTPAQVDRFRDYWPNGTFVLLVSNGRHILTIKDRKVCDWSEGRALHGYKMWRVVKA